MVRIAFPYIPCQFLEARSYLSRASHSTALAQHYAGRGVVSLRELM